MDETVLIESLFRQINEWKEKAKKWDEHKCPPSLEFIIKQLSEYKEKAQKWDNRDWITKRFDARRIEYLQQCNKELGVELDKCREKAKKWDSVVDGSHGVWKWSDVKEWQEKAKKWDAVDWTHAEKLSKIREILDE